MAADKIEHTLKWPHFKGQSICRNRDVLSLKKNAWPYDYVIKHVLIEEQTDIFMLRMGTGFNEM